MKEVVVFVTGVEPMADMAIDLLWSEEIPARKSVNYRELCSYPLDGLGEIEVIVPESATQQALEILSARFSEIGDDAEAVDDADTGDEMGDEDENSDNR